MANIMRIIKAKLPDNMQIGTDTKKALNKITSLFILYLSTVAADIAKENNRTSVSAEHMLSALRDLEFDDFLLPVETALAAFRETEKARSIENAAKAAAKKAAQQAETAEVAEAAEAAAEGDAPAAPAD